MSDETRPLAGLPPADRTLLIRAPLELAIAEVRFVSSTDDLPAEVGLQIRRRLDDLGYRFARLERAQEGRVSIEMNQSAAPASRLEQVATGWQLHSADGGSQVTLMPGAVVLQTNKYERWSVSLRPVLQALLTVTEEVNSPSLVNRIGLRYVDRFVEKASRSAADWVGRIDDTLLGPTEHPVFGGFVRSAQQQVELSLGDAHGALLRHGPFVDAAEAGAISYLLDIDVFDLEPTVFDVQDLLERAEILNRTAASLFQTSLTQDYLRSLQRQQADQTSTHAQESSS